MTKVLCLSAVMLMASSPAAADWEELPKLPEPNGGFICGANGSRVVIVGGTNWEGGVKNWLRSVRTYDPAKREWKKAQDLPAGPVAYGVALHEEPTPMNNILSFVGGSDGKRALKFSGVFGGTKTEILPLPGLPDALVISAGGAVGDKGIIVGGADDAANIAGCQRSTHSVESRDGQWFVTKLADYPGKPFCVAASSVVGDELFIFGGANWDSAAGTVMNTSEAHAFSVKTNTWRKLKPLPYQVRGLTGVALDDHRIYLAGGFRSDPESFTDEAWIYDVKNDSFTSAKPLPYRATVGLVLLDGFVYCIGGEDKMKARTDKFYRIKVAELVR